MIHLKRLAAPAVVLGLMSLAPVAAAQTGTCDTYFTASSNMNSVITPAFDAIKNRNASAQAAALPGLEAEFAKLTGAEVKPEVCNGNHINAYTTPQYVELNALRARGINDFPADLPIVKQPDLNHASLAYAVGWIKFEKNDFTGALVAFEKGLTMFPRNKDLANEKLATLMRLERYQQAKDYADAFLTTAYEIDDETRAKIYYARGVAMVHLDDLAGADESLTVAQRYNFTTDAETSQKQVREALAAKKN